MKALINGALDANQGGLKLTWVGHEPLVQIKNLYKKFKKRVVINNLNLTISQNQHLALIGHNGAGKSLLLDMIAGIIKPSSGKINYYFYDQPYYQQIGMQFQTIDFLPNLSVFNMIKFTIDLFNVKINNDHLNCLIDDFEVRTFLKQKCVKLSGGQKQRLNLLLALLNKPKLLLLDEFATGLDHLGKIRLRRRILDYCNLHGITIVTIAHDIDDIDWFANEIAVLDQGQIIYHEPKVIVKQQFKSVLNLVHHFLDQ